ncbi:hypothetical protein EVAR_17888_1 [Eumeta japonica]|uniref:Uncharacterized protein n=1 Tax=Eumeta variegata TaxID=151549 RepID=A0A4C1UYS6_EUMVA|nr:hypothetical protein EVAR_17888_1 [Eumeta japonica]
MGAIKRVPTVVALEASVRLLLTTLKILENVWYNTIQHCCSFGIVRVTPDNPSKKEIAIINLAALLFCFALVRMKRKGKATKNERALPSAKLSFLHEHVL